MRLPRRVVKDLLVQDIFQVITPPSVVLINLAYDEMLNNAERKINIMIVDMKNIIWSLTILYSTQI